MTKYNVLEFVFIKVRDLNLKTTYLYIHTYIRTYSD